MTKRQERETKRQKAQEEGVGFSVEQLKNHRELLASTLPGEQRIGSELSSNSIARHPEDNDHHAAKIRTIFYHPVANALQNGIGTLGCRPPTMLAVRVTNKFHEQIVTDTRTRATVYT